MWYITNGNSQLSKNFQWKYIVNWLFFCKNFRQGICKNAGYLTEPFSRMVKGIILRREYRGRQGLRSASVGAGQAPLALITLWAKVQGAQLPCAGQGRQPLPSRSDACVAPYWVLPDAEIGRTGSKAALLPSCAMGENERNCLSPACREQAVSIK